MHLAARLASVGPRILIEEGCWRSDDQASRLSQPMSLIGDLISPMEAVAFGRINVTSW